MYKYISNSIMNKANHHIHHNDTPHGRYSCFFNRLIHV